MMSEFPKGRVYPVEKQPIMGEVPINIDYDWLKEKTEGFWRVGKPFLSTKLKGDMPMIIGRWPFATSTENMTQWSCYLVVTPDFSGYVQVTGKPNIILAPDQLAGAESVEKLRDTDDPRRVAWLDYLHQIYTNATDEEHPGGELLENLEDENRVKHQALKFSDQQYRIRPLNQGAIDLFGTQLGQVQSSCAALAAYYSYLSPDNDHDSIHTAYRDFMGEKQRSQDPLLLLLSKAFKILFEPRRRR